MATNTNIEWCDHTFNPWEGCTKVSPGCAHCYAEARNKRFSMGMNWGRGAPRRRTSAANWKLPLKWNQEALVTARAGHPRPRVFCASLADWLDNEVPTEWLSDLIYLIVKCNHLDWLLLTKRPQLWRTRLEAVSNLDDMGAMVCRCWLDGNPPPNVWIGTTVEDQQRAVERIPELLSIPAKVRFLSCEPLLDMVDLIGSDEQSSALHEFEGRPRIDWVICGGESGPGARPMHPGWARSLRDQCRFAGVPFLFKQWGEYLSIPDAGALGIKKPIDEVMNANFLGGGMLHVGKKRSGRLLDGIEHNEFPAL